MTVSDMWARNYSLFTGAAGVTRHIYSWHMASGPYVEVGPKWNMHPLAPYSPPAASQRTAVHVMSPHFEAYPEGSFYRRLTGSPTLSGTSWDFSTWSVDEVCLRINASGFRGEQVDGDGIPIVWEFGGADFSTPFPSWVFTEPPTHFRISGQDAAVRQIITPLLSHTAATLVAASQPRTEMAHIYTAASGPYLDNGGEVSFTRIKGNGGPVESRHTPWDVWSDLRGYNRPTITRSTATGDLVGSLSRGMYGRPTNWVESTSPIGVGIVYINHHFSTLPTLRFRGWGYVDSYVTEALGAWSLQHIGLNGDSTYTTLYFYPTRTSGDGFDPVAYDATLDLNTVTTPAGTLYTLVTAGGDGYYVPDNAVLEGPETPFFPDAGSRSGVGGSVYVPGRVLKLGNVTDAGVAT